jgi:hypothetical protein
MSVATVPIQQATIRQYAKRLQLPTLGGQFAQVPESTQGPMFSVYSVRADRCAVARASPRNKNSGFGDVELDSSTISESLGATTGSDGSVGFAESRTGRA